MPQASAGQAASGPGISFAPVRDRAQAIESTRFHFTTLKQFQGTIFSSEDALRGISGPEAFILNTGLSAFLSSGDRETMLLAALRQNKSVRLRFQLPVKTDEFSIVSDPRYEVLFQLKPEVKHMPMAVEIHPLLDGPVAFEITIKQGEGMTVYEVNWAGDFIKRFSE